ncbi:MAG: hypothetical protein K2W96_12520 [Gemmataceae bacterium]|nr:hypothetical protein [Gemmataceae bacterium]
MSVSHCPICYGALEVREVAPCVVCGGWPESVERFSPSSPIREWRLPSGEVLALCEGCLLEEFMVTGGWGYRLGLEEWALPVQALQPVRSVPRPALGKDKFCPGCNLRLAFIKVVAARQGVGDW